MDNTKDLLLSVSEFIELTNQTLENAFPSVGIEGEVSSFKVNQGKYVFFDLKDEEGSIGCFMTVWQLRTPIEDGMKVIVSGVPKLTKWGKFSLTVRAVRPSGEGSIRRSFEILKSKLEKEGLFAEERKRPLPVIPRRIAVISSTQAAGYADFMKILNDRWGGLDVLVAHVQVQGESAPDQIIRALEYFNSQSELPDLVAIVRGGGSADDLSVFNDEKLVRAIATSRIPTVVGVGHEVDTSLADLVADVRAATPSNAAQIIVPDKNEILRRVKTQIESLLPKVSRAIDSYNVQLDSEIGSIIEKMILRHAFLKRELEHRQRVLAELDPGRVLSRGYAIIRGKIDQRSIIEIEKIDVLVKAEVKDVYKK